MKIKKYWSLIFGFGAIIMTPTILTSCSLIVTTGDIDDAIEAPHYFINDRTFSIRIMESGSGEGHFGTGWIFYHETDTNITASKYQYYMLTNLHVSSDFNKIIAENKQAEVSLLWTDKNTVNNYKELEIFSSSEEEEKINNTLCGHNVFSKIASVTIDNYKAGPFEPIHNAGLIYNDTKVAVDDMTAIKVDFSNWINSYGSLTGSALKERLDNLNDYAKGNNGYVMNFEKNPLSVTNISNLYTAGYPLQNVSGKKPFDNANHFRFAHNKLTNGLISKNKVDVFRNEGGIDRWTTSNNTETDAVCIRNEYFFSTLDRLDRYIGPGASGSVGIVADDINNINTYKVMGIYWGTSSQKPIYGSKYIKFDCGFQILINANDTNHQLFVDYTIQNRQDLINNPDFKIYQ